MNIIRFIVLFLCCAPAMAGVYKWKDTSGAIHFSDKPPATAAEELDIKTKRTEPPQLTAAVTEPESTEPVDDEQLDELEAERERVEQQRQIQIAENCNRAKKARDSLFSATRVYEPLPGGGRRYLEQDEVDQRKNDAERDVDEWCNQDT